MAISFQLYDLINFINDFYFVQWQLSKELGAVPLRLLISDNYLNPQEGRTYNM